MDKDMLLRMSGVLKKAVDLYTEINMEDLKYRQIDFAGERVFDLPVEGDYKEAFRYIINEKIDEKDALRIRSLLSPESLAEALKNPNIRNITARYRLKNSHPVTWMELSAILLREIHPEYVCIIDKNVTKDVEYEEIKADNIRKSEYEHQLKQQQERIRSLLDDTDTIIYEYDIANDVMSFAGNAPYTNEKIDYDINNYIKNFDNYETVYKDDKESFLKQFNESIEHGGKREIRYRANYFAKGYRWYKAFVMGVENASGVLEKVIGRVDDINMEMETENMLRKRAETDELTGVLNKATITGKVQEHLKISKGSKSGALFIFDIDNFKMVNDVLGHLFGDFFLQTVASTISDNFRDSDYVGRIGGDEFMAFMSDIRNEEDIKLRAEKILKECREIEVPELKSVKCSIGIAASADAASYKQLFQCADTALYMAKQQGKDCFVLYDASASNKTAMKDRAVEERNTFHTKEVKQTLSQYIFDMLYNAVDIEKVISSMLRFMGEYVNVSRAYIFENDKAGDTCSKTFEWCIDEADDLTDKPQEQSRTGTDSLFLCNFDEDGIFYCRDINHLPDIQKEICLEQGIKSMLRCTILDAGSIRGMIGFDECRKQRFWTKEQIDMIRFASRVLSTFLLKKRVQDEIEETSRSMYEVLDKANSSIYIVEPDTYQILYANAPTNRSLGRECSDRPCYEEMFGRNHPCDPCPIKVYEREHESKNVRIYNNIMNRWFDAEAKPICWKKEEKIMVQCKDITDLVLEIEELKRNQDT